MEKNRLFVGSLLVFALVLFCFIVIGGQTVKGPAAKMFRELGIEPSALAVARHYCDMATGFVLDTLDRELEDEIRNLNLRTLVTNTLMKSHDDRKHLADAVLEFTGGKTV